nr:hypothetical protein Iba_scaffold21526CG0020 [Ipomoea batatas]
MFTFSQASLSLRLQARTITPPSQTSSLFFGDGRDLWSHDLKPLLHVAAVTTPAPIPATVPPPPSPSILVTQSPRLLIGQKSLKSVLDAIVLNWYYSELAAICINGGVVKGMICASTSRQNLEN